ncbi:Uncharacterised protein [Providencia rettgeri]|uniref:Uncharacterized protein n=1 Tax=Providencia rettgeri TaxID=587 RepID=A0A9N8CYU1_PRORE|nr:Uncharacterised protein [Providencia rettgeri]CAB5705682.1 Uncharacterised protein [Providencia rettgeri]CAC9230036.1 Uncharacterised protein [Providencia rettgeri]CAC9260412.1 Uncharacterised protein [Providencia rettgeri]
MRAGQSLWVSSLYTNGKFKVLPILFLQSLLSVLCIFCYINKKNVLFAFLLAKSPYTKSGLITRSLLLVSYRYLLFITMFD